MPGEPQQHTADTVKELPESWVELSCLRWGLIPPFGPVGCAPRRRARRPFASLPIGGSFGDADVPRAGHRPHAGSPGPRHTGVGQPRQSTGGSI